MPEEFHFATDAIQRKRQIAEISDKLKEAKTTGQLSKGGDGSLHIARKTSKTSTLDAAVSRVRYSL